jgi:hypothetical protein
MKKPLVGVVSVAGGITDGLTDMAQLRVASHKCLGARLKIYDRLQTIGSPLRAWQ